MSQLNNCLRTATLPNTTLHAQTQDNLQPYPGRMWLPVPLFRKRAVSATKRAAQKYDTSAELLADPQEAALLLSSPKVTAGGAGSSSGSGSSKKRKLASSTTPRGSSSAAKRSASGGSSANGGDTALPDWGSPVTR
jgi:hypothetical protein